MLSIVDALSSTRTSGNAAAFDDGTAAAAAIETMKRAVIDDGYFSVVPPKSLVPVIPRVYGWSDRFHRLDATVKQK